MEKEQIVDMDTRIADWFERDIEEQYFRVARSKAFFENVKHTVTVQIQGPAGVSFIDAAFPSTVAAYNESRNSELFNVTDASFYVQNKDKVMLGREHLPEWSSVKDVAYCFTKNNYHRELHNGPSAADCVFSRPHVQKPPERGESCNLISEGDLKMPIVIDNDTKLRFVVKGFAGTDGSEKYTDWIKGKDLVAASNQVFMKRRRIVGHLEAHLKSLGPGGSLHVQPHPLLFGGIMMSFLDGKYDPCADFFGDRPVDFKSDNHARLATFSLVWRKMAGGKRALAIASATVMTRFNRPAAKEAGDVCAACLEEMEGLEWKCGSCNKMLHHECVQGWRASCQKRGCAFSCPMCRAEI